MEYLDVEYLDDDEEEEGIVIAMGDDGVFHKVKETWKDITIEDIEREVLPHIDVGRFKQADEDTASAIWCDKPWLVCSTRLYQKLVRDVRDLDMDDTVRWINIGGASILAPWSGSTENNIVGVLPHPGRGPLSEAWTIRPLVAEERRRAQEEAERARQAARDAERIRNPLYGGYDPQAGF